MRHVEESCEDLEEEEVFTLVQRVFGCDFCAPLDSCECVRE